MKAVITGENDERVGVNLRDNNDVEHIIEMEFDGEIKYHEQDGYPDAPSERTDEGNEHVEQARRFAKYTVFKERGYETVVPRKLPEWVAVVATVVAQLSPGEFEQYFGDYHRQFRSTVRDDVDPVVDVPADDVAGLQVIRQNIHLSHSPWDDDTDSRTRGIRTALQTELDLPRLENALSEHLSDAPVETDSLSIAGVSDVGVLYQGHHEDVVLGGDDTYDGPADARLELAPMNVPWDDYLSPDAFHLLVVYHLLCQVRDCYLQMGLEPPEGVRYLGMGTYRQTMRNEHRNLYQPVHHTDAEIDGYRLPDLGTNIGL